MKKFIVFCLMALMVGIFCEVSNATSPSLKNGSAVVATREIPYADNPSGIREYGAKIPKGTRLVIYQYGTTISRVRVANGNLNGKFVYVRTYHLNTFAVKTFKGKHEIMTRADIINEVEKSATLKLAWAKNYDNGIRIEKWIILYNRREIKPLAWLQIGHEVNSGKVIGADIVINNAEREEIEIVNLLEIDKIMKKVLP